MDVKSMEKMRAEAQVPVSKLRAERDELNLKMHLAKAEIRDEWQKLEPKWEHFQSRVHAFGESVGEAAKDLGAAVGILGEEIGRSYERVRKALHA